jgi:hypothetical protein
MPGHRSGIHYLAYPATICMDCQAAITDDAVSETIYKGPNKGTKPVTPADVEQVRQEIFKDKEQETILQDKDTEVEEDFPTYSQDSQEYMHWHYKLNHPSHIVMTKMPKENMIPRRITKILTDMDKLHTKQPMCNDCCGAKATRRPWRSKSAKHNQRHLKKATYPGEVISVD